eukprot:3765882-Pyramimonas_sp.AAC.1
MVGRRRVRGAASRNEFTASAAPCTVNTSCHQPLRAPIHPSRNLSFTSPTPTFPHNRTCSHPPSGGGKTREVYNRVQRSTEGTVYIIPYREQYCKCNLIVCAPQLQSVQRSAYTASRIGLKRGSGRYRRAVLAESRWLVMF